VKIRILKLLILALILCTVGFFIKSSYAVQDKKVHAAHGSSDAHPKSKPNSHPEFKASLNNCTQCHAGIEDIRNNESGMMQAILKKAKISGFEGNDCIICHGGNPDATTAIAAHQGSPTYFKTHKGPKEFYPDPGSPWINENTCGMCHQEQVSVQFNSLMATEAGKIQGSQWGFGAPNGYNHDWANFDVEEKPIHQRLGSEVYKKYMEELKAAEPQVFPKKMHELPKAPTKDEVEKNPSLAAFTYIRQECQRCHTASKGRDKVGEFRGIGCSSCHIPYSSKGFYEGNDKQIDKDKPGHILVHNMQGSRECEVSVNNKSYTGIPSKTCVTCHNRGRRIGPSFMGLMETAYKSPFMSYGEDQEQVMGKNYLHLHADLHKDIGMLCQDCHTSQDVHSDGLLAGTTMAPVEIECQDCHGTPNKFPWELPIGYGDEVVGEVPARGKARGLADSFAAYLRKGTVYPKEDGYLLSARGNPIPKMVKKGNKVLLHSAGGKDFLFSPLKTLLQDGQMSENAKVAMVSIDGHIDHLECYACHDDWAPQCYGCHIKVDYSGEDQKTDWVATTTDHDKNGLAQDAKQNLTKYLIDGKVSEQRSYLRFEDPPLAINGEHRVSPSVPGCQTTVTVIGKNGKPIILNKIFRIKDMENGGTHGQKALDMAVLHPHTVSKKGRSCESCHGNPKAMGYGISNGELVSDPSKGYGLDITNPDGDYMAKQFTEQINAIPELDHDWSRFVTEDGEQLQTVGHHLSGERPLNNEERAKLDRRGTCQSCHSIVPDKDPAGGLLSHIKDMGGIKVDKDKHNDILKKNIRISAWVQVLLGLLSVFFIIRFGYRRFKKH